MSYNDTLAAFGRFFATHWTATPILWPNTPFDPPRDSNGDAQPYVAFKVAENAAEEITLGSDNPWYRPTGIVSIDIYTPEHTGHVSSGVYADMLKGLFKRVVAIAYVTDISVLASDHSFNSITTDFLTHGFVAGLSFTVSGLSNPLHVGTFTVTSVTQRKLVVTSLSLVDEAAGASTSFHVVKSFDYRNSGLIRPRAALIIPVGINAGWFQTNVTIPYTRDSQS